MSQCFDQLPSVDCGHARRDKFTGIDGIHDQSRLSRAFEKETKSEEDPPTIDDSRSRGGLSPLGDPDFKTNKTGGIAFEPKTGGPEFAQGAVGAVGLCWEWVCHSECPVL